MGGAAGEEIAAVKQGVDAVQFRTGGGVGAIQVSDIRIDDQHQLLPEVIEGDDFFKEHQIHVVKALLILGVQMQGGLGVFDVIIGEIPHQSAGERGQPRESWTFMFRQKPAQRAARV